MVYFYDATISNFGNVEYLLVAPWTLDMCVTIAGIVGAIVQSFFAYRVWKVSKSLLWLSLAWTGAAVRVAFSILMSSEAIQGRSIAVFVTRCGWQMITSLSVSLGVDILNVATLTWYLSKLKSGLRRYSLVDKTNTVRGADIGPQDVPHN